MSLNQSLFHLIFSLSHNSYIADFAMFLSYVYIYLIIIILIIWSLFFVKKNKKVFDFSLIAFSGVLSWFAAHFLKITMMIPRPYLTENIVPLFRDSGYSFPSEHAAVCASLALSGYFMHKHLGYALMFFALLIGLSRIVIGVHYPIDVVAGYCVGVLFTSLVFKFLKK
ncbi:MAG: phosphatase PAP2 family protein [Candidatus Nomurabacteria bacterium]|nr:phosphatase PAP2 family protein [Candidatus Nomurabacteria bacterium]